MYHFIFFHLLVCDHFCNKIERYQLSYWNILVFWDQWKCQIWIYLIYFDKKDLASDSDTSYGKMSDFVSFLLFGFTLVIKLRNFNLKAIEILKYFSMKKICQVWICPVKQCLIWFELRYMSRILVGSWEMWVLKFIELV